MWQIDRSREMARGRASCKARHKDQEETERRVLQFETTRKWGFPDPSSGLARSISNLSKAITITFEWISDDEQHRTTKPPEFAAVPCRNRGTNRYRTNGYLGIESHSKSRNGYCYITPFLSNDDPVERFIMVSFTKAHPKKSR